MNNEIEIEVRVGRGRKQIRKRWAVNPLQYTTYNRTCLTYKFDKPQGVGSWCNYEYGNNPHWKNWWQGAILIDVRANTVEARDYFCPTNGSFHPGEIMSNWECESNPQWTVALLGTTMPWSTYYQSAPQFPQVMASMAMESAGFSGYPWSDPANYPIQCPDWCFGGSELDANMQLYLNAAMSSGLEFGKMYLMTSSIVSGTGARVVTFQETNIDTHALSGEWLDEIEGPQTALCRYWAESAMSVLQPDGYTGTVDVKVPGAGTHYVSVHLDYGGDVNECIGDSTHDTFVMPQPPIELEIPAGE